MNKKEIVEFVLSGLSFLGCVGVVLAGFYVMALFA